MKTLRESVHQTLYWFLYMGLAFFVLTACWNTGWNLVGDPYALGPYLPWLELVFPLAGLGLWCIFFTQWAAGDLRAIHVTRWFYLLLFVSLLMINVLFSSNGIGSLGYLSLWLSGSLVLSLDLYRVFAQAYFWGWYMVALGINLVLWHLAPALINVDLLVFTAWLGALHGWQKTEGAWVRYGLSLALLVLSYWVQARFGLQLLVLLSWVVLWGCEYKIYRRKFSGLWYGALISFGLWLGFMLLPQWETGSTLRLPAEALAGQFSLWFGVGWGQLEWAQYAAQTTFKAPETIVSSVWLGARWWYETGLLLCLWLPSLWLLTVGHAQSLKFRSVLFWSIALLAPSLWLSPGGILLGCFWFFNQESWGKGN